LKCVATAADTSGDDPRFGPWGKQKCDDTGPLTQKRMETVDREFINATLDFVNRANRDNKPFFVWFNSSRMHIRWSACGCVTNSRPARNSWCAAATRGSSQATSWPR
jgi:arylsulfatase A-like enzyme